MKTLDFGKYCVLGLSPMDDVTDMPFRALCKDFGADLLITEFIASEALNREAEKSYRKMQFGEGERPVGIQIFGADRDELLRCLEVVEARQPDFIDINWGCPVRKVAGKGAGSGILKDIPKMLDITAAIVQRAHLPVTVKTRLGYDESDKPIVELAERLQDAGIAALTIHGRTRAQLYKGTADWTLIGAVKRNPRMHIPIIGNGDITTPEQAKEAFDRYGVDGIMIGRASFGHPWIFREVKHYLATGELLPPMSVRERVDLAKRHLAKSLELKGDRVGIFEMRRHLSCYFKGLENFKETRLRLVTSTDPAELYALLDHIAEVWG